jgi:hypothetical protein
VKNSNRKSAKKSIRISKKQYNLELNAAMKRMDFGEFLTQSQVDKLAGKW